MMKIKISRSFNLSNYELTCQLDKQEDIKSQIEFLSRQLDNIIELERLHIRKMDITNIMVKAIIEAKNMDNYSEKDFDISFINNADSIEKLELEYDIRRHNISTRYNINVGYPF